MVSEKLTIPRPGHIVHLPWLCLACPHSNGVMSYQAVQSIFHRS
jgi:hypothetical protein